jgi:ribosomal protein S12 methylthiotransferase RimO
VTLGCARNEVDSEELAARLSADGWTLVPEGAEADVVLVNTCGFIEAAKKDSIDTVLEASDGTARVVAVGCMAERYGKELSAALPEATVLSFDDYPRIGEVLRDVMDGRAPEPHTPADRRTLLPITPVDRPGADVSVPGHSRLKRLRLDSSPVAPVKLASGCDRRCTFCAIPSFRGSFTSREPGEVLAEIRGLVSVGVREALLVSENSTSYGKDLGDIRLLERLLPELGAVEGLHRVRVSYLQPAEMRPGLIEVIAGGPGLARYFDLSFQHASPSVLRRMRRFGGSADFLALVDQIRALSPGAGIRSNVIVGFPGETEDDVDILENFLAAAQLDAIGVFGYSAEDGTEAAGFVDVIPEHVIRARVERIASVAEVVVEKRASLRIGSRVSVIMESPGEGRADHQGPEDGVTLLTEGEYQRGDVVTALVVSSEGADLVARPL